ncbi:MAG: carbohydrate kinase family protein [Candidatus Pacebacteria bacterium]|nr:carbohydrate kinase family protein [Candidatus Paceibacterota bacterium]MBP9840764.1 carbohydrate kinase family protein [Candidatus Paceibacterota bacterium]
MKFDFLAVGDVVTEPFIRLLEAKVTCDEHESCTISMHWGDKIPYESAEVMRAVGNASNAAVAAARIGLTSALVADIGDDEVGKGNLEQLTGERVDTSFITTHAGMKSNYHYVLWFESERTILVRHEEYPYRFPEVGTPAWLYLSSLSANSEAYHDEIAAYLAAHPETRFAFQPGTFQMKLGSERLKSLYERADLFFCNKEEAMRILGSSSTDVKELMKGLKTLGPKSVVLTDNRNGAYALHEEEMLFIPMYPDTRAPFERTGAGDAFASTVTAALSLGKTFKEALLWGPINSMAVVQKVGAQQGLLTRDEIERFLADAPSEYQVSSLR